MNNTAKKQNRILLITLVIVLAAAAILLALTGTANRKEKEENPPLDTKVAENTPSGSDRKDSGKTENDTASEDAMVKKDAEEAAPAVPDITDKASNDKKTDDVFAGTDTEAAEAAAIQSGVLPTFTAPTDGPVLKGCSLEVPVFSHTMNDYRTHAGLDFACSPGTPVTAAADGTVCEVTDDPMMGVTVGISHSGGAVTRYKGLSEESMNLVSVGDNVKRGQTIGASGSTALIESAEEDHLHFELEVNGVNEDPAEFMRVTFLSEMVED